MHEKKKKKGKFPLCERIGHRPLQGHCPKGKERERKKDSSKRNFSWFCETQKKNLFSATK